MYTGGGGEGCGLIMVVCMVFHFILQYLYIIQCNMDSWNSGKSTQALTLIMFLHWDLDYVTILINTVFSSLSHEHIRNSCAQWTTVTALLLLQLRLSLEGAMIMVTIKWWISLVKVRQLNWNSVLRLSNSKIGKTRSRSGNFKVGEPRVNRGQRDPTQLRN